MELTVEVFLMFFTTSPLRNFLLGLGILVFLFLFQRFLCRLLVMSSTSDIRLQKLKMSQNVFCFSVFILLFFILCFSFSFLLLSETWKLCKRCLTESTYIPVNVSRCKGCFSKFRDYTYPFRVRTIKLRSLLKNHCFVNLTLVLTLRMDLMISRFFI